MKKKKICFISQFPPPIHGLSKAVETLYTSELRDIFEFEKIDITNNKRFLKNILNILNSKSELFYFTISQSKFGNLRDLIILNLLRLARRKCIIHLHGGYYRKLVDNDVNIWQKKMNYNAIQKVEGVIVLGESLKSIFHGMVKESKIYVIPNCVDNKFLINDDSFIQKVNSLDTKVVKQVLYLSNFIKSKGYTKVLEMALIEKQQYLKSGKRRFHFNFAGRFFEKEEEEYFYKYYKQHELEDYITYHGVVNGDRKLKILEECDIFVLLTRYPNEGQPISILEAMGNGMSIVTTDHAGIPDIVSNNINGIVLALKEEEDILNLYNSLFCDTSVMKNNRDIVLSNFTEEIYIQKFKDLFEKVLSS